MADGFALVSALGGGIEALLAGGSIAFFGFNVGAKICCASAIGFGSGGSIPATGLPSARGSCKRIVLQQ